MAKKRRRKSNGGFGKAERETELWQYCQAFGTEGVLPRKYFLKDECGENPIRAYEV